MGTKVTKEGFAKLQEKYEQLLKSLDELRREKFVALELSGDNWHDNPYFNKMEQEERALGIRISELKATMDAAEIVEEYKRNVSSIALGSIVECKCLYVEDDEEEIEVFEIVNALESDLCSRKLNIESLVARNILGMTIGEKRSFETPGGQVVYEVVKFFEDWSEVDSDK